MATNTGSLPKLLQGKKAKPSKPKKAKVYKTKKVKAPTGY